MANAQRAINTMNAVRAAASDAYQSMVPEATLLNVQAVGNPITEYSVMKNEFLSVLPNVIFEVVLHNRLWNNELSYLKKSAPLGADIEELIVNPAKPETYDPDNSYLTSNFDKPDVKAVFHRINRKDQFKARIYDNDLALAFTSWEKVDDLIAGIINSLYSGDNIAEYNLLKQTLASAISKSYVSLEYVSPVTDSATASTFVTRCRELITKFKFPSTKYNKYGVISGDSTQTVTTFSQPEDIVLLLRADVMARVDVDVLARAFNLTYAEFIGRVIPIDDFGINGVIGLMCDRRFFQIYDKMRKFTTFYNPARLEWRYFWNVWQTYSISPFVDAVVFCTTNTTEIDSITVTGEALVDGNVHLAKSGSNYPKETTLEVTPIGVNIPLDTSWFNVKQGVSNTPLDITTTYADSKWYITINASSASAEVHELTVKAGEVSLTFTVTVTAN